MAFARCKVVCRRRIADMVWGSTPLGVNDEEPSPKAAEVVNGRCRRTFEFDGVHPQDGAEDERFWSATPEFALTMTITNPEIDFQPGRAYYLDFVRMPTRSDLMPMTEFIMDEVTVFDDGGNPIEWSSADSEELAAMRREAGNGEHNEAWRARLCDLSERELAFSKALDKVRRLASAGAIRR